MPEIFVNQTPRAFEPAPQTWGDLLGILDEYASRDGVMLTAARLDGVDIPAFRDPGVTAQRLASVGRVDVDTATPAAFVRQCLTDSIVSLQQMAAVAIDLSSVYRGADVASGHQGLAALALELGGLPSLVAALQGPLQIPLAGAGQQLEALGTVLDSIVAAQESEDWLTVADVLEYDLEPAIRGWEGVLAGLVNPITAYAAGRAKAGHHVSSTRSG